MPRLVLASASPARLSTLRAAGLVPEVLVSGVDESSVTGLPEQVALTLSQQKARAVAGRVEGDAYVVGCDSVLEFAGAAYGKPVDAEAAVRRWRAMRGKSGVLHTGHTLIATGQQLEIARSAATVVRFAALSDEEIDAYVATGEPLGVAGAFTLDGFGGAFVTGVEGDPHNVVGISLPLLRELFAALGVAWPSLWSTAATQPPPHAAD